MSDLPPASARTKPARPSARHAEAQREGGTAHAMIMTVIVMYAAPVNPIAALDLAGDLCSSPKLRRGLKGSKVEGFRASCML